MNHFKCFISILLLIAHRDIFFYLQYVLQSKPPPTHKNCCKYFWSLWTYATAVEGLYFFFIHLKLELLTKTYNKRRRIIHLWEANERKRIIHLWEVGPISHINFFVKLSICLYHMLLVSFHLNWNFKNINHQNLFWAEILRGPSSKAHASLICIKIQAKTSSVGKPPRSQGGTAIPNRWDSSNLKLFVYFVWEETEQW